MCLTSVWTSQIVKEFKLYCEAKFVTNLFASKEVSPSSQQEGRFRGAYQFDIFYNVGWNTDSAEGRMGSPFKYRKGYHCWADPKRPESQVGTFMVTCLVPVEDIVAIGSQQNIRNGPNPIHDDIILVSREICILPPMEDRIKSSTRPAKEIVEQFMAERLISNYILGPARKDATLKRIRLRRRDNKSMKKRKDNGWTRLLI